MNADVLGPVSAPDTSGWQVPAFDVRRWLERTSDACVIVPVINEGPRIARLLDRMRRLGIASMADIIIVDGGSTDGSIETPVLDAGEVRALLVKTGPGKLSAQLRCAYAFALKERYTRIVTIDGNDKDDPEAIPRFLTALSSGYDFVQASRFLPGGIAENTPRARTLAIRLIHAPMLRVASGFPWTDTTQGFRGYSAKMLADPRVAPFRDVFISYELLAYLSYRAPRLGYRCVELATTRRYPAEGKVPTKISFVGGNLSLLKTLARVCRGDFDPGRS